MEFLTNLFWFPLESLLFIFNVGLWALLGYGIYEGVKQLKDLIERKGL